MDQLGDQVSWFLGKVLEYFREPFASWDAFLEAIGLGVQLIVSIDSKTGWMFLLSSVVCAGVIFLVDRRRGLIERGTSVAKFIFPRYVYRHRSAVVDYKFVAVDLTLKSITYGPLIAGVTYLAYKATMTTRDAFFPDLATYLAMPTMPILTTLIIVLVADFGFFLGHYLAHKIPIFWFFHQVHHSAEVLTPVTVYRGHPVDETLGGVASGVVAGVFATTYTTATGEPVQLVSILGVNVFSFAFFLIAYQLRHSHIWLSYGPVLSWIFISPAQHQIHHSKDPRHYDKNFGFLFAIWDAMFGSLYVPKVREKLQVGLVGVPAEQFSTVWKLYYTPFVNAAEYVRSRAWFKTVAGLRPRRAGGLSGDS